MMDPTTIAKASLKPQSPEQIDVCHIFMKYSKQRISLRQAVLSTPVTNPGFDLRQSRRAFEA